MNVTSLPPSLSDPRSDDDPGYESPAEMDDDDDRLTPVYSLAYSLVSFEYANLKINDKSGLQIYGEISIETRFGDPPYLYRRTEAEAHTIPYSDKGFGLPLTLPDWSLTDDDCYRCDVKLYEKGGGGTPLLCQSFCMFTRSNHSTKAVNDWDIKIDEPVCFSVDNDRANFTLCLTRILRSITCCFSFRIVNPCNDEDHEGIISGDEDHEGKLMVSGTIKATQTLTSGVSRMLTLFDSSSGEEVPPKRPIPLVQPVLVVQVQTEKQVETGGGPHVAVDFDLELRGDGSGDQGYHLKGKADLELKHDHGLGEPIFPSVKEETTHKCKYISCSNQGGDDRFKIKLLVIPYPSFLNMTLIIIGSL